MKFNADAYNKLFPRKTVQKPIESVVETFKPTEEVINEGAEEVEVTEEVEDVEETEGSELDGNE